MIINIKARNITISEAVEKHFNRKLTRMEKLIGRDVEANVNCSRLKGQDRVEVTLLGSGIEMRAEDAAGDLYSALDLVCERLERQVERYKTKYEQRRRKRESIRRGDAEVIIPEGLVTEAITDSTSDEEEDSPHIVRSKRFALKPLDPEEACMQMELLGHSFFVFLNTETEAVNVVYKRKDGDYGLIEPE